MDDAKREPAESGTGNERESGRTATAEFRIPAKVDLTRPDIPVRRPPEPEDEPAGEPADTEKAETGTAETAERPETPEPAKPAEAANSTKTEDPTETEDSAKTTESAPEDAPPAAGTGPTRVERLPVLSPRPAPPQATPQQSEPAQAPPQAAPHQAAPPQADRAKTAAQATAQAQTAPPQTEPSRTASPEAKSPQAAPPQTGQAQDAPAQAEQAQAAPAQAGQAQAAPPQATPAQAAPAQTGQAQAEQARDASQQDAALGVGVRASGPWSVPWDGQATPVVAPPAAPAPAEEQQDGRGRRWPVVLVAALVLVAGVVTGQLVRPVPEPSVELTIASSHAFPGQAPVLPWPASGQSAVHVEGLGTMGAAGGSASIPTASVAKVMTAYVYLQEHPLGPGEPGPVLTVSPEAAAEIPARKRRGESILGVTAGQRLTQRKALEALLVISANDVAHELARWDAGGTPAFVAKMNETARSLGMTGTRYTDPSGYDSGTVSTAADQVRLLRAAMEVPAFAEIVSEPVYVPGDGGEARQGGNFLLGQYGVIGGKTGYTDAAGGNFVFAARKDVQGVETLIVGAVMGQETASAAGAVDAAQRLVVAAENALVAKTLAPRGARVGRVDDGLGDTTPLRAAAPVTVVGWGGLTVPVGVDGAPPRAAGTGERVAALTAGAAEVPLEVVRTLEEPSAIERLIRLG
ncbi:serine hydrolase [Actinomadura welshii]